MTLIPLDEALKKFNKDKKNPLEQLSTDQVKEAVAQKPPALPSSLTVRRDERGGRIPYRLHETGGRIIEAVGLGATYRLAAQYAGISTSTLYKWLERANAVFARILSLIHI